MYILLLSLTLPSLNWPLSPLFPTNSLLSPPTLLSYQLFSHQFFPTLLCFLFATPITHSHPPHSCKVPINVFLEIWGCSMCLPTPLYPPPPTSSFYYIYLPLITNHYSTLPPDHWWLRNPLRCVTPPPVPVSPLHTKHKKSKNKK